MTPTPLTLEEFNELDRLLFSGVGTDTVIDLPTLDGFIAGVASSPVEFEYEEWRSFVCPLPEIGRYAEEEFARLIELTTRHMEFVTHQLAEDPESYQPMVFDAPNGFTASKMAEHWSRGFISAVAMMEDMWTPLLESESAGFLAMIRALTREDETVEERKIMDDPELQNLLIAGLPLTVRSIHQFWKEHLTKLGDELFGENGSVARMEQSLKIPPRPTVRGQPKIGRNDPCPCGSGKKFKKCCGG